MAHEVEIKVKTDNLQGVKEKFEGLGFVFNEPIIQEDVIYTDPETAKSFDENIVNALFLRIRKVSNGKILFTLKKSTGNELDGIEHETEISNPEEMHQAILLMGNVEAVRLKKERQAGRHPDKTGEYGNYEICLDKVDGLGTFFEVERCFDKEVDGVKVQEELWKLLDTFGVSREDNVTRGYDTLMYLNERLE